MLTGLNNKLYVDNRSYVNTKGTIKYGQSRKTDIQNKKTSQYLMKTTMHKLNKHK